MESIAELGQIFNDKRLGRRFLVIKEMIQRRMDSLISNCFPSVALRAGAYRFFSNNKVTPEKILTTHYPVLKERIVQSTGDVLMIQDSSTLSYPSHPCTKNLGRVGTNSSPGYGVITHNSLCFDDEQNIPLGLSNQTFFSHTPTEKSYERPIEEKESYRWIEHLRHNHALCPHAIHICDREADIFELLCEANSLKASFVIRQSHNRALGQTMHGKREGYLLDHLEKAEIMGTYEEFIQHESVLLFVKAIQITIAPPWRTPEQKKQRSYHPLQVTVVQVTGKMLKGDKIDWTLLTSLSVSNIEEAQRVVRYYTKRWQIELFHKALKTGFSLEEARLEDGINLQKLIALISIEAVCVYAILYASRLLEPPPISTFLDQQEIEAITFLMREKQSPSLSKIINFIAVQGGFIKTKKYPHPGLLTFFRGWNRVKPQIDAVRLVSNR